MRVSANVTTIGSAGTSYSVTVVVANRLRGIAAAPSAQALHASHVQQWVESAKQAVAARSIETSVAEHPLAYERGIQVLEQLLVTLVPKSTVLLANYPNPFNPETWIPYRLAKGSDVQLRIYDMQGRMVRHLNIGHQAAGVYQTRSRAAYWDGTNAMGGGNTPAKTPSFLYKGVYFHETTDCESKNNGTHFYRDVFNLRHNESRFCRCPDGGEPLLPQRRPL